MLVDYWDPDSESFQIDGMSLTIEVEDIYGDRFPEEPGHAATTKIGIR